MTTATLGKLAEQVRTALGGLNLDEPNRNVIRELWDRLRKVPGGPLLFSLAIGRAARYTGSIRARVTELRPGCCRVELRDRPRLRNHLGSVHAIALVNLAEMAGNLAVSYSLPPDARFIVAGLTAEYMKKARGTIVAEGTPPPISGSARQEYTVPVLLKDASGEVVARCSLKTLVGPKKSA